MAVLQAQFCSVPCASSSLIPSCKSLILHRSSFLGAFSKQGVRRCCRIGGGNGRLYYQAVCCSLSSEENDSSQNVERQDVEQSELRSAVTADEETASAAPSRDGRDGFFSPSLTYGLITSIASLGFSETAYLTYMKLLGGPVSCPIGGASCNDVLNSDYATVFGFPLSAIGLLAYGTVAILGVLGITKTRLKVAGVDIGRWGLLGTTGAMASASAYFMYILSTKLEGASCAYCVASALLSVSLLLLTLPVRGPWIMDCKCMLKNFSSSEIKQVAGMQLAVTASVIVALSSAYAGYTPALTSSTDIDLPPVEPLVTMSSTTTTLSLAKHLQSIGAKMYGAFWCSHCYEQKQMFGREAMKYIEYVECYPEGYRRGVKIAKACDEAHVQGFPTWIIKGEVLSGEQELSELARVAGFDGLNTADK